MQRLAGVGVTALVWRVVLGLMLLAFLPSTGRGYTVPVLDPPSPPVTIADAPQRLFALDVRTGEVVFDQVVQGSVRKASLSDGQRASYSVMQPGAWPSAPLSDFYVQDFGAETPTLLRSTHALMEYVAVTDSRAMWAAKGSYEIHSLADGTSTRGYISEGTAFQLSKNVFTYIGDNFSDGPNAFALNLDTGEYFGGFFGSEYTFDMALPRRVNLTPQLELYGNIWGKLAKSGPDSKSVFFSNVVNQEGGGIFAGNLLTNGKQIVFTGLNSAGGAGLDLHLYDSGNATLLASAAELRDVTGSPEFSISANSIAWAAGLPEDRRIWIRDITSGVATQLQTTGPGLRLWDLNNDYILLSSDVLPVPEPSSCLLLTFALASGVRRQRSLRRRRCTS